MTNRDPQLHAMCQMIVQIADVAELVRDLADDLRKFHKPAIDDSANLEHIRSRADFIAINLRGIAEFKL